MGLFSIFGKKSPEELARKHAKNVGDKRGYAPDRWESIRSLAEAAHPEAAKVLLTRFTFRTDPSITDQEEKDLAFKGVVAAGEGAIPHVRAFLETAESATWPVKMLAALLPESSVVDEILAVLEKMDPSYTKDPQRKIQLLVELEDRHGEQVVPALLRFLDDPNEAVRFHVVSAIAGQSSITPAAERLQQLFEAEESARLRAAVLDAFVRHEVAFPESRVLAARAKAPNGFSIAASGRVTRV